MKIFVLDDDVNRHKLFNERLINEGVEIFSFFNANDFCDEIHKHSDVDFIFLDHDLADFGENSFISGYGVGEINGSHVASQIVEMEHMNPDVEIVIHSVNPVGAQRMKDILSPWFKVSHVPFPVLMVTLKVI